MEQNQTPKNVIIDLRRCNNSFIRIIKSQSTGVEKRCICIPIEDNFIDEGGYVDRNNHEIRTAKLQAKLWPVSEESRQQYGKKHDWDLRLDISLHQQEELAKRDPDRAARLSYNNNAYDKELVKQVLPYIGQAYDIVHKELPPESAPSITVEQASGEPENDLPF